MEHGLNVTNPMKKSEGSIATSGVTLSLVCVLDESSSTLRSSGDGIDSIGRPIPTGKCLTVGELWDILYNSRLPDDAEIVIGVDGRYVRLAADVEADLTYGSLLIQVST
jgi:hypothetical protein